MYWPLRTFWAQNLQFGVAVVVIATTALEERFCVAFRREFGILQAWSASTPVHREHSIAKPALGSCFGLQFLQSLWGTQWPNGTKTHTSIETYTVKEMPTKSKKSELKRWSPSRQNTTEATHKFTVPWQKIQTITYWTFSSSCNFTCQRRTNTATCWCDETFLTQTRGTNCPFDTSYKNNIWVDWPHYWRPFQKQTLD